MEPTITITISLTIPVSEARGGYARQLIDDALDRRLAEPDTLDHTETDDEIPLGFSDLTVPALDKLWRAINSVHARATLALMATKPEGYYYEDLYETLDASGQKVGGWLSSVGFAVNRTGVQGTPIRREWRDGELWYCMDKDVAAQILALAARDSAVQTILALVRGT